MLTCAGNIGQRMDHRSIIRGLLKQMDQVQLASELHVTQPTVSRWLSGSDIKGKNKDRLLDLAHERGVLADSASAPRRSQSPNDRVDEIDLTAGLGGGGLAIIEQTTNDDGVTFAAEVVRDFWRLPTWVLNRFNAQASHIKAMPAQGDSMSPTIEDGDVVFVDTRHRVPSPPGVYALADEFGGVVVKRLEVVSRPREEPIVVRIMSDNPRHSPQELTLDEVAIIGRYVGRFTT